MRSSEEDRKGRTCRACASCICASSRLIFRRGARRPLAAAIPARAAPPLLRDVLAEQPLPFRCTELCRLLRAASANLSVRVTVGGVVLVASASGARATPLLTLQLIHALGSNLALALGHRAPQREEIVSPHPPQGLPSWRGLPGLFTEPSAAASASSCSCSAHSARSPATRGRRAVRIF